MAYLKQHKKSNTITTTLLIRFMRRDGKLFHMTNHFEDVEFNNTIYKKDNSFSISAIAFSDDLAVNNAEITAILDTSDTQDRVIRNSIFSEADLKAGVWEDASFIIYEVNYENTSEYEIKFRGRTGRYTLSRSKCTIELRSFTQKYSEKISILFTNACRANFADNVCRLNKADFTHTGRVDTLLTSNSWIDESLEFTNSTVTASITSITKATRAIFTAPGHNLNTGDLVSFSGIGGSEFSRLNGRQYVVARLDSNRFNVDFNSSQFTTDFVNLNAKATTVITNDFFKYGVVKFTSGNNAGIEFDVSNYRPNFVEIQKAGRVIFPIQVGDEYEIVEGCDKLPRTCRERFNNKINFDAEDFLPSMTDLASNS